MGSDWLNPETGEIVTVGNAGQEVKDATASRLERFALQSVVRDLIPNGRTAKCLRFRQSKSTGVGVWRSHAYKRAHYGGLQTCANVWACPVCAAKISERRRAELQAMIAGHEAAGGIVLMVTRTVPHNRCDDLRELLAKIAKAETSYKGHRDYKATMRAFGMVGTVRALEVTHGDANGWHPHVHELVFLASPIHLADLEEDLFRIWRDAAVRAGLDAPSRAHGLQVQDGAHAAKYASKWGLESELTQWHRKRGKVESRTPFDLLRWHLADKSPRAGALFCEYAEAFHGRHQLQFSRGLKARFQITEYDDEELSAKQDADAVLLGTLTAEQWRVVCKTEHRGTLLEIAGAIGWQGVLDLVDSLMRCCAGRRGDDAGRSEASTP